MNSSNFTYITMKFSNYNHITTNNKFFYETDWKDFTNYMNHRWWKNIKFHNCTYICIQERTSDATITINLLDVNDNYPVFDQPEYSANITESALPASQVVTVSASDLDTGKNGQIVYSIKGEGSDAFTIHPSEGHIQVKATAAGRSNLGKFFEFSNHPQIQ